MGSTEISTRYTSVPDRKFRIGIIGCGLIGQKRAQSLGSGQLVACADIDAQRASNVAHPHRAKVFTNWRSLLELPDIDIVIVATLHDSLAAITFAALQAGKHVLVEKPAARNIAELRPVIEESMKRNLRVRVGFNHRYHRAFRQARRLYDEGLLGKLMFIRARYGHGGRIGYDKEWRANAQISGGGELIDQGPHLIDLARWFLGDFTEIDGFAHTFYWNMPVDDNGFMILKTESKQVAFLHASCTEWKNLFSMEIYGERAKLEISGLGGSYGVERLAYYKMLEEMGPPETTIWEYPMPDDSWHTELAEFYEDILLNRQPAAGLADAHAVLQVIQKIYKESGYDYRP